MRPANIILEYLDTIVWPAVAIVAIFVFRKSLNAVLHRVTKASLPGGVAIDFAQDIRDAQQLSRAVAEGPAPPKAHGRPSIPLTEANARMLDLGLRPSPSGVDMSYYRNLADVDPNIALAGLRMEIETLARNLAHGFSVPATDRDSATSLLRKLYDAQAITTEQFQLGQKIVSLCNQAVHGRQVSREEANVILDVAQILTKQYVTWLSWGFADGWTPRNPVGG